jgi:hypothetical protein
VLDERVVQLPHRHVLPSRRALQHRPERFGERDLVGRPERLAQLLGGLVSPTEFAVGQREQAVEPPPAIVIELLPGAQHKPACATPDASHPRTRRKNSSRRSSVMLE